MFCGHPSSLGSFQRLLWAQTLGMKCLIETGRGRLTGLFLHCSAEVGVDMVLIQYIQKTDWPLLITVRKLIDKSLMVMDGVIEAHESCRGYNRNIELNTSRYTVHAMLLART